MSDLDVLTAIEEMEQKLRAKQRNLDSGAILEWQTRFQAAVATAERGEAWPKVVQKAQVVQGILERTLVQMMSGKEAARCDAIRHAPRNQRLKFHRLGRS